MHGCHADTCLRLGEKAQVDRWPRQRAHHRTACFLLQITCQTPALPPNLDGYPIVIDVGGGVRARVGTIKYLAPQVDIVDPSDQLSTAGGRLRLEGRNFWGDIDGGRGKFPMKVTIGGRDCELDRNRPPEFQQVRTNACPSHCHSLQSLRLCNGR